MKRIIFACLFIFNSSMHAAAVPDPWLNMTLEQKINYTSNVILQLYQDLEITRQQLVTMKIWLIDLKNGSLEFHCNRVSTNPTYILKNMYRFTEDELMRAKALCYDKNGFNADHRQAADDLITAYLTTLALIALQQRTLNKLRKQLDELNEEYKKPILSNPTT